jgi:hypothetical protein
VKQSGAISSPPFAVPPPCAGHPDRPAHWYCPACRLALCDDCLRISLTPRGTAFAPCPHCRNACEEILDDARRAELKAEADRAARQRFRHHLRLYHAPAALLITALLLHAWYALAMHGPAGLLAPAIWLVGHLVLVTGAWAAVHRWLSLDFDPAGSTVLRLAALATAVHLLRTLLLHVANVQMPDSVLTAVAALGPLAFCYVLIPLGLCAVGLNSLFDLDMFELIAGTITLFMGLNITYVALMLAGAPA